MKRKFTICTTILALVLLFPSSGGILYAADFAGNETYYQNLCITDPKNEVCDSFKSYLAERRNNLLNEAASIESNVAAIQSNIDAIQTTINEQQKTIDALDALIAENEAAIVRIQNQITILDGEIKQTEEDIKVRDETIKNRMVSEQANIATNVYAEFIMGATDLVDMIRIASGIEQITENDQNEIKALEADKQKLVEQVEEQNRLKADQEKTKAENEENQRSVKEAQESQKQLQAEYQKQEANLLEQVRSAKASASAIQSSIISMESVYYQASDGWIRPLSGGYSISAGTFSYPGGGFHAGLDFAAGVGTPIVAPIGGVVVYASNPYGSYSGYLTNYSGHPAGAGNSVHMVGTVNGTTYGVSFFHMAQEGFGVSAGSGVSQGTVIGRVGHSGNSTGAHLHIEIINLGDISTDDAIARFRNSGADFAWGTGWSSYSTTCSSKGYAPCRERPESFFGM